MSKVKGQGPKGQFSSSLKMHCNALAANNVMQQKGSFRRYRGGGDGSAQTARVNKV